MTPTPRLRFVERILIKTGKPPEYNYKASSIKVLQQWFAYDIDYPTEKVEWKDVPTEAE